MIYNIETLPKSELLRLIMGIHNRYKAGAIDDKRIREELDKTEALERKKQIAKDIANSGYSQEELLNVLSNISDHSAEEENMSNDMSEPYKKLKSASVQGLIDATNRLVKEMADKSIIEKKVVKVLKASVARIIINNVNDTTLSLYVDSKGNYKTEKAFRLVFRKARNSDFCKSLADLMNESHTSNTSHKVNESEIDNTDYLQKRQDFYSNEKYKNIRLNKVAKELNVGIKTIVEFLGKKGHFVEAKPNARITNQQYDLVLAAFGNERNVKEKSIQKESIRAGGNRIIIDAKRLEKGTDNDVDDSGNSPKPISKNARKREERRAMIAEKRLKK